MTDGTDELDGGDELDDEAELDADEAVAGDAIAADVSGETLDARVTMVLAELAAVPGGDGVVAAGGRPFAVVSPGRLEVLLDGPLLAAAQRTPDVGPSSRGRGWIAFAPRIADRYALDRAEAWLRMAHRGAATRR